jgi:phosphatidylethanolamine/phosphatidyl-N-methylethanolamine N-methyltransferase
MNVEHMAFADATFDSAVVLYAMSGLPDPARAVREIKRVCRPGARIVIANHFLSRRPVARICDAMLSPIYRLLRYRADLDLDEFVAQAGVEVSQAWPANPFGYSTVIVCRDRRAKRGVG